MKPVVSREKIPKIFTTRKLHRRGMFSHRSMANIQVPADLQNQDVQFEFKSTRKAGFDESSMPSLAHLNTQRDTPSFGGQQLESPCYIEEDRLLPEINLQSGKPMSQHKGIHRSNISQSLPYLATLDNAMNNTVTQSDTFLPHLCLTNQRETPSFLRPGEAQCQEYDAIDKINIDVDSHKDIRVSKSKRLAKKMKLPLISQQSPRLQNEDYLRQFQTISFLPQKL